MKNILVLLNHGNSLFLTFWVEWGGQEHKKALRGHTYHRSYYQGKHKKRTPTQNSMCNINART